MPKSAQHWIVETDWLASHLSSPDLIILDGSWHLPTANRDAKKEYLAEHIPGALFFDIDDLSDEKSPLPHMLPSTVKFASRMKKMGIGDGARIVVYDTTGIFSAARVWWTFPRHGPPGRCGAERGAEEMEVGGPAARRRRPPKRSERHYTPLQNTEIIRDLDEMQALLKKPERKSSMPDLPAASKAASRTASRTSWRAYSGLQEYSFTGTAQRRRHVQVAATNWQAFPERRHRRVSKPVVTTCGSGVTASMLALALAVLGQTNAAVYDGSWAEWGQENGLPVETGPAR